MPVPRVRISGPVAGRQTWRLVRDAVAAEPLEPLRLRGKSQPVTAFRLLQIRSDVDPRARRGAAPLVGRASQLRILGEAFANVVRERPVTFRDGAGWRLRVAG